MAHTRTALSVALLMLAGCGTDLSVLGPTPPDQGIVIFMHADYAGSSQAVNVDVHDLTKTEGPCSSGGEGEQPTWKKCVSSVRVFPGWSATLYDDEDFKGRSITLTADTPNLRNLTGPCDGSFNDCVRSIRVTKQ
jgi:Peptidase inhibitor family I36